MTKKWRIRNKYENVILFFNGWGMDHSAVDHMQSDHYDLVEFNDYRTIDFNECEYSHYEKIYVVAWSLGVWVASFIFNRSSLAISKAVAINGTPHPINAKEGIRPSVFEGTLKGWNKSNRELFLMRTIGAKSKYEAHATIFGKRTIENQKEELASLYKQINVHKDFEFKFNTAIIGNDDAIFTAQNQVNYWQSKTYCKFMDLPHYPFLQLLSWDVILRL
ncbi:pimeloyl-ACP methyl esterase BioG family protein [Saccharicrinis fermentans]|uniref:DUF452 family protein n=1 Tax=Saccharicrinis fermentans DSM 9555 = JCM 21142 TaxID=869213 RepID=W7Y0L6_9BACT|nr:pimeloyl-ACP methyl esterase BioG family protein [Saccharicrinis fermentans]GAF04460.1 hypothetical protein JCM21142_83167 [Saccharicrinis fermentans DSM 9555 = JCM 21142]